MLLPARTLAQQVAQEDQEAQEARALCSIRRHARFSAAPMREQLLMQPTTTAPPLRLPLQWALRSWVRRERLGAGRRGEHHPDSKPGLRERSAHWVFFVPSSLTKIMFGLQRARAGCCDRLMTAPWQSMG